ncbi:hypothetical protein Tsubulata_001454 [Turnera subulata]|uniref:DUF4283 domain-containing protein n=1 Tax=Turnera subulata TaxID=218843 RepID=A0A9Q0FDI5_9ROSI|nr:hypothetical protein Tsubulata_001454 [Turnera subulata]
MFELLRPWHEKDGPSNRKVWIRAKGIPLHAWSNGFFHKLVSRIGSLIAVAPITESKSKLDYAFLQVITTVFKPISWEILANIDDLSFSIIIDEIQFPPSAQIPHICPFPPSTQIPHISPTIPALKPTKSLTINPATPKSPSPSSGDAVAIPRQNNSDPFQLRPIIENSNRPMNVQNKRISTRRKAKKTKPPSPACSLSPKTTNIHASAHSVPESSTRPSETPLTTPFCGAEADKTIELGNDLGWDCSYNLAGTRDEAIALIANEGFDWSKTRTV